LHRRLLLLAILGACSRPAPTDEFQFRVAAAGELALLGPHTTGSFSVIAQDWVFEPLARFRADGTLEPALASTFERVKPNLVRVRIRNDARFSDGSPVTLGDVVESLQSFQVDAAMEGDAVVVQSGSYMPDSLFARSLIFKRAAHAFLGTGPFVVVEQDPSHILLRRTHPAPDHINEVLVRAFGGPRDAFIHTLAGDADSYPLLDPKQVEFFEGVPRFRIIDAPSLNAVAIAFSSKRLDRETRLALLANLRGPELGRMAYGDGCKGLGPESPPSSPLPAGPPLDIGFVRVGAPLERMALAVQRILGQRAGEIQAIPYGDYTRRISTGDFDLLIEMPIVWPESEMALNWRTNSPLGKRKYSNPLVDAEIDVGNWGGAVAELMKDPPVDYVCLPQRFAVVDSRIKNARIGPYGFFETLPDWEIGP
jgi:hypothetical protein